MNNAGHALAVVYICKANVDAMHMRNDEEMYRETVGTEKVRLQKNTDVCVSKTTKIGFKLLKI